MQAWAAILTVPLGVAALGLGILRAGDGPSSAEFLVVAPEPGEPAPSIDAVRYGRDVRPILADRCFLCHGPDGAERKADLRLDSFETATASRGDRDPAIVPGDLEASPLWHRITSHDPDEVMPPPESNKRPISPEEREIIRRWIEAGAEYEPHWAFIPPRRPTPPEVSDQSWGTGAIDRFVLARLEAAGLRPSSESEPANLLRRVFLDLTGLPPTPEEVLAYLADERPDRFERWVDRLLSEEPYVSRHAERMAVPWLDLARYADTSGIHMDNGRSIWPWRDWVLRAYRDNMPFDRFVVEQLAGDLIPDATRDQQIASGFNRNHITTDEGGVIADEYLLEYAVDRVSTTGSVFMGLTLGCARCHDHKFDPVSMEDFYSLIAFFNSIEEPGLYSQTADPMRAYEPFIAAPTADQAAMLASLGSELETLIEERDQPDPGEDAERAAFFAGLLGNGGVAWAETLPGDALSEMGAELAVQGDGSVLAAGPNPDGDVHVVTWRVEGESLRLLALEALPDPSMPYGRVGRAPNGNAVLGAISVEAVSVVDPTRREPVALTWAWADVEQSNGNYHVENALDADPGRGWAVGAHLDPEGDPSGRVALFLADRPFGFAGGTDLVVRLDYRTPFAQHTLGRIRLTAGTIAGGLLERLPAAPAGFYRMGQFTTGDRETVFDTAFGPEESAAFDPRASFEDRGWAFELNLMEGSPLALSAGVGVDYVAREVFSPTARDLDLSLGSDDGIRLFVNGDEVFSNRTDRGVAPDQDSASIRLQPGRNTLIYKIVNTGGPSGIYTRTIESPDTLPHAIVARLLPEPARRDDLLAASEEAWRLRFSPQYREASERVDAKRAEIAAIEAEIPRTMVMKERAMQRPTYVMDRGQYDHPLEDRPVERAVPVIFGELPEDAPSDRLGLARWLVSEKNPLLARVTINRYWEMFFGAGIVGTSEDFGLQGEWPSHPEMLDWLAVEYRESGWDTRHILRLIVTSATYRQDARIDAAAREHDPTNRLLAYFPRQRLTAEQIRDQALFAGGLLVEKMGGPSVKPYQPEGLWREIAMPNSNTRIFQRDDGEALWRRSMYTYWKRAAPPPAMLSFDAPTREFCNVRRLTTNTPLQALVLWNDEQFVEASRAIAARTLRAAETDDSRLEYLHLLCAARPVTASRLAYLKEALGEFRSRYASAHEDARALLAVGEAPLPEDLEPPELAAWTLLANALLSSDVAIVKD